LEISSNRQLRLATDFPGREWWLRKSLAILLSVPACLIASALSLWHSLTGLRDVASVWGAVTLLACLFCILVGAVRAVRPGIVLLKTAFEACVRATERLDRWAERVFPKTVR
jgi:hypothetical protein